jgi:hypothetical protein
MGITPGKELIICPSDLLVGGLFVKYANTKECNALG